MSSIVRQLAECGAIDLPRFLPANIMYEAIVGSHAYADAKREKEKINPLDRLAGRGKMDLDERKTFTKVLIMRYTIKHLILMENRSNE